MTNRRGSLRGTQRTTQALITLVCYAALCGLGAEAAPVSSETDAIRYLSPSGYVPPVDLGSKESMEATSTAISNFQVYMGINDTSNTDAETADLITLPRCGFKHTVVPGTGGRTKRQDSQDSKWEKENLTYKITKYSRKLAREIVDKEIARAFAVWSEHTDLIFRPKNGEVDIEISFMRGKHGDGQPFYGSSDKYLAHAFSPNDGGDIHFNDEQRWTFHSSRGYNFFETAVHEIGHSLGLDHNEANSSVMFAYATPYNPDFKLSWDDIQDIQKIYGPKTRIEGLDICTDPKIDTMFKSSDGHIYVFKGEYYWKLTDDDIAAGYPKLIAAKWKGLPSNIDAAFTANQKTYFFKGSKYWKYNGRRMDKASPRKISAGFPGIPNNIDAVTSRDENRKVYFFKGTKYWRYDFDQPPHVKSSYPKPISKWRGLPNNLDAAFTTGGYSYFFKGSGFHRMDDTKFSVDQETPYETGYSWFDCD